MLMVPMPPALMDHREDWNRADSTSLGSNWRLDFNTMKIATNRVQFKTPANGDGRAGAWASYINPTTYNGGRLLTDNWAVEAQLIAPVGGAATDNITCIGAAMLDNGPASGMVLVYFGITTGTGSAIFTYANSSIAAPGASNGQTGQTQRAGAFANVANTSLIRFERRMVTATRSIFTCFVNGSSLGSWDDTTGIVPAGDRTKRRWFIQQEGNFPIFQQAFYSPAQDSSRAYDLKS